MPYGRVMGLNIYDDEIYTLYREAMTPILKQFGGRFGYDFKIAEVLKSKTKNNINRVFTIEFPSEAVMDKFFNDPAYIKVKNKYFDASVDAKTVIVTYE
tara:strand:+ start:4981 stop:5277 length:297 start_codon:yes stop_codon:yes gene_type:complete